MILPSTPTVSPRTYVPQDQLYVWAMVNPAVPTLVGEVSLSQLVADCATFVYTQDWWNFALSENMPIVQEQIFSTGERGTAPGVIDDARPDRWGERIIRHIDRPARLSILEMLLFAGDDRFGALGVSTSAEQYIPRYLGPYPQLKDLAQLAAAPPAPPEGLIHCIVKRKLFIVDRGVRLPINQSRQVF